MDLAWTMLMANMIMAVLLFLLFWIDKDGILNMLKLKLMRGRGLVILFGRDGKMTMTTTQIAGKKSDTEQIKINDCNYTLNRSKIFYYKTTPVIMYDEGISEPLAVKSGEVSYGKLTPELLSQMLAMARQSGRLPQAMGRENLMFYLMIASAGAGIVACFLLFNMGNSIEAVQTSVNTIGTLLTEVGKKVLGG